MVKAIAKDKRKPFIGIANTWNEISLSNCHLKDIAQAVKEGILAGGGVPFEFQTIAVSDGYTFNHEGMKYVLASRELIADSIEMAARAYSFDGLVFIAGGDKPIPAAMMAMLRLDLPGIMINGGYSQPEKRGAGGFSTMDLLRGIEDYRTSIVMEDYIRETEEAALTGAGDGSGMYTPNSMACLAEALGLALPYTSTFSASSFKKLQSSYQAGEQICRLVKQGLSPRKIVTPQAMENAIRVGMTIGISTNSVLHLLAIAAEARIPLTLADFHVPGTECPLLCPITPSGPYTLHDLHLAGGIPAVMKRIQDQLHLHEMTVSGETLGDSISTAEVYDETVIRPLSLPVHPHGSIRIIYGNLAPQGAVTRPLNIAPHLWKHQGTARVFSEEKEAIEAIYNGKIERGNIIVLSYQGPKGGPGMQEVYGITSAITRVGLRNSTILLTDGRFSGAYFCACIGHICPEAADQGPLAIVKDGDTIAVDIPNRSIDLLASPEEMAKRLQALPPFIPKGGKGYLKRYVQQVGPACEGATLRPFLR